MEKPDLDVSAKGQNRRRRLSELGTRSSRRCRDPTLSSSKQTELNGISLVDSINRRVRSATSYHRASTSSRAPGFEGWVRLDFSEILSL